MEQSIALIGNSAPWLVGLLLIHYISNKDKDDMGLDFSDQNSRVLILVVAAGLIGSGGGGYMNAKINDPRPDPFTGTQAILLKQEITLAMKKMESDIRRDMPPPSTKARIRSIELHLHKIGQDNGYPYEPPSYEWH